MDTATKILSGLPGRRVRVLQVHSCLEAGVPLAPASFFCNTRKMVKAETVILGNSPDHLS
jgi:hypothetical protein